MPTFINLDDARSLVNMKIDAIKETLRGTDAASIEFAGLMGALNVLNATYCQLRFLEKLELPMQEVEDARERMVVRARKAAAAERGLS